MTDAMVAVITVASLLVYTAGAGVLYAVGKHRKWEFDELEYFMGLLLWPLALPALGAATLTTRLLTPKAKLPRAEVRRG